LNTSTQERVIRPARNMMGSLRLPGDKSISHRYAMLGAFAEGTSRFTNFSTGADCASTLGCMEALGAKIKRIDGDALEITGVGGQVTPSADALDCGNSGSTMRMMSGLLAPQEGRFTLMHELAHVAQQQRGEATGLSGLGGDEGARAHLEDQADAAAARGLRENQERNVTHGGT